MMMVTSSRACSRWVLSVRVPVMSGDDSPADQNHISDRGHFWRRALFSKHYRVQCYSFSTWIDCECDAFLRIHLHEAGSTRQS